MLYIVPTPIGNLEDMTFRAINVLKTCDLILCEDTRTSAFLLRHFEISTPMKSFHAHNEHSRIQEILTLLKSGSSVALISDAGTPGISDPGFLIVRACKQEDIAVSCLPGASALIPALVASGMPTDKFFFEGFLPHKKGRQTRWQFLSTLKCTIILYESPFRLLKCLEELKIHLGDQRLVCVAREISKKFEEFRTSTVDEAIIHYTKTPPKGEIVIVIDAIHKSKQKDDKL